MSKGKDILQNTQLIIAENAALLTGIRTEELESAVGLIHQSNRLFFLGLGRSGLALKMAAMRLMHLGLHVYVVGEITTPAILEGDLLIVASGSGTTASVVNAVTKALAAGAKVLALTADESSILAHKADQVVLIPAASKTDFSDQVSKQYAGSLFEQFTYLLLDGVFMMLWQQSGKTKEDLWPQHANLE